MATGYENKYLGYEGLQALWQAILDEDQKIIDLIPDLSSLGAVLTFKGFCKYSELPTSDMKAGDVWIIKGESGDNADYNGKEYVYTADGSNGGWVELGDEINSYASNARVDGLEDRVDDLDAKFNNYATNTRVDGVEDRVEILEAGTDTNVAIIKKLADAVTAIADLSKKHEDDLANIKSHAELTAAEVLAIIEEVVVE